MPKRKQTRIIIDTNLWISFLIGKRLHFLKDMITSGKIKLIFASEQILEIQMVTQRPKVSIHFHEEDVNRMLRFIRIVGEIHVIKSIPAICRDPKDDFLLGLAIQSKADYLITGDKDLLAIKKIGTTKIIPVSQFHKEITSAPGRTD